ncbi:MAG: helix-turn-helix transcriptional regulator [Lachnospiraceae bacterium]|nr:helix-turn-helix transcriptional regulator [Lachnospiraceae bacterium]
MSNKVSIKHREATDERQYMLGDRKYEVYEKTGAPIGAEVLHCHNFYEVIYVCEGEYAGIVGDRTYYLKKGDFLLIDKNVMHRYHYVEKRHDSSRRIIIWVEEKLLRELSDGKVDLTRCFSASETTAYHFPIYYDEMLRAYLLKLVQETAVDINEVEGAKEILDKSYLSLFFVYLNELCMKGKYATVVENSFYAPMVMEVSAYIEKHIADKITLDELAEHVHISKYYFLRKFKEYTGMTVHEYIINKRLIHAREMLKEKHSLQEAWMASGFNDYTTFLRNFKKVFGVAPGSII